MALKLVVSLQSEQKRLPKRKPLSLLYSQSAVEGCLDGLRLLDTGVGWNVIRNPDVASDNGVVTDGNTAKDRGIGVNGDVVLDNRVARHVEDIAIGIVLETLGTKRHTLIQSDMITYNTCFADDDTSTMIDGKIFANLCARVDIDTRLGMGQFSNDTGNDGHL